MTKLPIVGLSSVTTHRKNPYHGYHERSRLAVLDIAGYCSGCTKRPRHEVVFRLVTIHRVKEKYPDQLMADISTLEEGLTAVEAEVDFVGTTLSGYTDTVQGRWTRCELIHSLCNPG